MDLSLSDVQLSEHRPVGQTLIRRAFEALAQVERRIGWLGDDDRSRPFVIHGRMAVANGSRPARQLANWASAPARRLANLPAIAADVVYVGRPDTILRCRAFYQAHGLTLALHSGWMQLFRGRPLLHGAATKDQLSATNLIVPRTVEIGSAGRHTWVVEEIVDGYSLTPAEWPAVAPDLLGALFAAWSNASLSTRPLSEVLTPRVLATALRVIEEDDPSLRASLRRLAEQSATVLVGPTHGDPVPNNVLRTGDDRLGLADWERAAFRPIGHDVMKVAEWLADPSPLVDRFEPQARSLGGPGAASLREQVVAGALIRLARSARAFSRANYAGLRGDRQLGQTVVRNRQRTIQLIARLLAE